MNTPNTGYECYNNKCDILKRYKQLKEIAEESTQYIISYKQAINVTSSNTREILAKSLPYMVYQDELSQERLRDYEKKYAEYLV